MPRIFDLNLAHFQNRLNEVPLNTEPYSYLIIPEAFHPTFYEYVVYLENRLYEEYSENYQYAKDNAASYSDGRYIWSLTDTSIVPKAIGMINDHMREIYLMLEKKFNRYFKLKDRKFYFVRDVKGYSIAPHTDARGKAITTLLYMPEEDGLPLHGTDVCVPKEKGFTSNASTRFKEKDFDIVASAPFEKNTMFSFVRSDNSFHSSKLQEADLTRKLMMYVTYGREING